MNLNAVNALKGLVVGNSSRGLLMAKKMSPEILVAVGIGGVIVSTVMACRASLKAEYIVDTAKDKLDLINEAIEKSTPEMYTTQDQLKDRVSTYTYAGVEFIKLYGPSVVLGAASIACIIGSHRILKGRNIALMAAYKAIDQGFREYRGRVVADVGEDKDKEYKYGVKTEKVETVETDPTTGKQKKVKKEIKVVDPNMKSVYARFFDENSSQWKDLAEYNLAFLMHMQNYANDKLHMDKHLFLNEVYEMLGLPHSKAGAIVGWVMGNDKDNYVDFGIFDAHCVTNREFVNGFDHAVLLDFNVDGVIYDLLP